MKTVLITALVLFVCTSAFALPSSLTINWSERDFHDAVNNHTVDGVIGTENETIPGNDFITNDNDAFSGYDNSFSTGKCPGISNGLTDTPNWSNDDGSMPNDNVIPEPTTIILLGLGSLGMGVYRKLRK